MLTIYRRHRKKCEHWIKGRKYRRCRCPIWVDGILGEGRMLKSLGTRDWTRALEISRQWELDGREDLALLQNQTLELLDPQLVDEELDPGRVAVPLLV